MIACDAQSGLWVFWFNADADSDPLASPDVPPGCWSGGLHFAQGTEYVDAVILQSELGPDHLEVLALASHGRLDSWYWSPGPGFQRRRGAVAYGVASVAARHDRGALTVRIADGQGRVRFLVSPAEGYPERVWVPADDGPAAAADAVEDLVAAGVDEQTVIPGTARRAVSTRHGGSLELTWRDRDGGLRHLGVPLA